LLAAAKSEPPSPIAFTGKPLDARPPLLPGPVSPCLSAAAAPAINLPRLADRPWWLPPVLLQLLPALLQASSARPSAGAAQLLQPAGLLGCSHRFDEAK
jgi:hypothetical protein